MFRKVLALILFVTILLWQNAAFCITGNHSVLRAPSHFNESTENFVKDQNENEKLGKIGFNPFLSLQDPEILNVFRQIVELRYDVRVLAEIYHLGDVPEYLTHKGEQLTVSDYVNKIINFLIDRADQDPHFVSKAFREEFPNMARPPELDHIFDEYMKIKIKEFDLEVVKDTIPPNSAVADIGAGKNKLGRQILAYSDETGLNVRHMIGTDLNDWADKTEKPDPRLLFIYQESGTRFPLSANTYDVVITKWVLHHMSYEDQVAFLKSVNHILRSGGRLVIFDSLGATLDEKEIWKGFQAETQNPRTWPKGSFFSANLKLTDDFMKLNSEQQLKVHALEDFFGHNLVMGRDWMPQPFTYKPVSELNELLTLLGFTENKKLRRVYGSAPIMRMGPPSIRLVFEKNITNPVFVNGGGGENKAMVLIDGITETEKEHVRNILGVLVYQDLLRKDLEGKKFNDAVILGNDRLDTFSEALELVDSGICKRIVIVGRKYGRATMPLIDSAVKQGFKLKISAETIVNSENWWTMRRDISPKDISQLIKFTEADIIKQIIMQLIEAYPEEFNNVTKKINADGINNVIVLIDTSNEVRKLYIEYRRLLDEEKAFDMKERYGVIFLHKPQQQLRSKAAFDEILAAELRQNKVQVVSHTVSYDNVEMEKVSVFKDLLGEAWRLIVYSDYGTGYINLRGEKYPRGIEDIPEIFWKSATSLLGALEDSARQEICKELLKLVKEEGLSIDEIAPENNAAIKEFMASVVEGLDLEESKYSRQSNTIKTEGLLFNPTRDFKQGQPLDKNLIQPKRSAKEVRDLLEEAREKGIALWIEGHLRGVDGPGSSLDLPEFQLSLTKQGARSIEEYPSTPTIASEFTVRIRFELADDPDVVEYIAPDYGIAEDKPFRIKGKVKLDEYGRTGQANAPVFIFNNIFGLKGIRVICEKISPIAKAGGMESSNVFNTALIAAASILSGAELSQADIFSLAVKLENDEFGGLTGGQGHICCLLGGAYQHVWLTGEKNEKGELINPYSAISIPLLTDEASLRAIEEHTMLVQAGKEYVNRVPQVGRAASLTGNMWIDLLRDRDEVGFPIHKEKLEAATNFIHALKEGDFDTAVDEVNKYTARRDVLTKRWLSLAIDAHEGVQGLPPYAYEYARKIWDEDYKKGEYYEEYRIVRDMYEKIGNNLKEISLYTLDPISSLVEEASKEGIAIMPLGAGGPGANLMAMSAKGLSHMKVFFEAHDIKEFDENEARSIIRGTGELKGYMPFKIGQEPLKMVGFEELGLRLPKVPPKLEVFTKDITIRRVKESSDIDANIHRKNLQRSL